MRRADQRFAPDVGLTQYVGKESFNPLADPVELEVRLSLNRSHQAIQMTGTNKEIAECADQRQRHNY